MIFSH